MILFPGTITNSVLLSMVSKQSMGEGGRFSDIDHNDRDGRSGLTYITCIYIHGAFSREDVSERKDLRIS